VRAAKPDEEAARMAGVELGMGGDHGRRVEPVDRDDAAGDLDVACGTDDVADLVEVLDLGTGQLDRRIAQLRQLGCGSEEDIPVSRPPHDNADWAQLKLCHVRLSTLARRVTAAVNGNTPFDVVCSGSSNPSSS
jgi:hypothetical protein